jgi:CRP-like cAMP-binding protein
MLDWSAALPEVTLPGGAVLIREGEVHSRLFVLVDGAVEVSRAGSTLRVVVPSSGR